MTSKAFLITVLMGYESEYTDVEKKVVQLEVSSTSIAAKCNNVNFGEGGKLLDRLGILKREGIDLNNSVRGINESIGELLDELNSGVDEETALRLDDLNRKAEANNNQLVLISQRLGRAREALLKNSLIAQIKDTIDEVRSILGDTVLRLVPVVRRALKSRAPELDRKLQGWFQRFLPGGN